MSTSSGSRLPEDQEDVQEHGTQVIISARRKEPRPVVYFGGNTDRAPTRGFRRKLYELDLPVIHGLNLGPTDAEIIEIERQGCIEDREELRRVFGAICLGTFSNRGGDGKTTLATMATQAFLNMNPGQEHPILIDINTSMTTLDVINGLEKKDFLTGKYWTMETLYAFIMEQGGDIEDFNDLHAKLAYRKDPQLPVIPLQLKPAERGLGKDKRSKFTAEQYLTVLRVLKKFFTVIIHDFGTDDDQELTREAFNQLHMLAVLTHTGLATTQMVGNTLEMLWFDFKELIENTVVIFNMTSKPSREALRAIALEKAGKGSKSQRLLARLTPQKDMEIQTPGQALAVINEIIEIERVLNPLDLRDVALVGFDPHLKRESRDQLNQVSETVRAHLWTALHRMLGARVMFERELLGRLPEELPPGVRIRRMHRLAIEVPAEMPDDHEFLSDIPEGFILVRRRPAENRELSKTPQEL
jgi:MinD-like ATPase involved in chromosome partitioning or flagellar assembly